MNIDGVPKEMRNDEALVRLAKISLVEEKVNVALTMCSALNYGTRLYYFSLLPKLDYFLD